MIWRSLLIVATPYETSICVSLYQIFYTDIVSVADTLLYEWYVWQTFYMCGRLSFICVVCVLYVWQTLFYMCGMCDRHSICVTGSAPVPWGDSAQDTIQVSFAKETYKRDNILQKRPILLSILLTVATPYLSPEEPVRMWQWLSVYAHMCEHRATHMCIHHATHMYVYTYVRRQYARHNNTSMHTHMCIHHATHMCIYMYAYTYMHRYVYTYMQTL